AFGVDFSVASDPETYERDLLNVNRGLLKYGTTSYCPTIVSSSAAVYHKLDQLKPEPPSLVLTLRVLSSTRPVLVLKVLQANATNGFEDFKAVYGFEGKTPEAQAELTKKSQNSVCIITCAPELDGIMETIPDLVKCGITVSVGHSMANVSQAEEAVHKGATFITHLFNAMPQFHHRDPGVIGLLGSSQDLPRPYYGLICDGIHVHPNSLTERIFNSSFPHSVITLDACIRNFIQFTKCSLIEALEAVTLHPAVLLGIQETKGVIKPGADADLVFLSDDLYVKRVFVAGEEVDLDSIDVQITEKF
ncbi:hypothetical protein BGW38_008101, partial [Lunasporangiospora selenospora]